MAEYRYDKKALKGLGISAFLKEVHARNARIEGTEEKEIQIDYRVNQIARSLHPAVQFGVITDIVSYADAKCYTIRPDTEMGCEKFAYFRAGQYIALLFQIGDTVTARPYSLLSSPKEAEGDRDNVYRILIRDKADGFCAPYALKNFRKGTKLTFSSPLGQFYYQDLRDAGHVVAAAGGSGITPFVSMAKAVADGIQDFSLTILYGCRREKDILLKEDLEDAVSRSGGKVRVEYILSDEEAPGYPHGFIDRNRILEAGGGNDFSLFACGPEAMYDFMEKEAAALQLKPRRVRFEVFGGSGEPAETDTYTLTVRIHGRERQIPCSASETILVSLERAGIPVFSDCRSGICGFCRSRLAAGQVYMPPQSDHRRMADAAYGWIHPCVTYPKSDVTVEVYPVNQE